MQDYSKTYIQDEDGFNGSIEAYLIETKKENLINWLKRETKDADKIYSILKDLTKNILIIRNLNVDEEFQGKGNGSKILFDVINDSFLKASILICDIGEIQKEGFILEKFYEANNFKTIHKNNDYPLMVYPIELADKIIIELNKSNSNIFKI